MRSILYVVIYKISDLSYTGNGDKLRQCRKYIHLGQQNPYRSLGVGITWFVLPLSFWGDLLEAFWSVGWLLTYVNSQECGKYRLKLGGGCEGYNVSSSYCNATCFGFHCFLEFNQYNLQAMDSYEASYYINYYLPTMTYYLVLVHQN